MTAGEERERPKAVTVIGWLWLVLAGLYLLRSLVDLVIWKALGPAAPTLLGAIERREPELAFLRPLFEHLTQLKIAQALAAIAVGFLAYQLLRLAPWARVAVQVICWIVLAYVVGFSVLWVRIWMTAPVQGEADPRLAGFSHGTIGLLVGFGVCLALAVGLVVMIALLRSSRVRGAFERSETLPSDRPSIG